MEAVIRLHDARVVPSGVRLVSLFGNIATCRVKRGDITHVRSDPNVLSMKAPVEVQAESARIDSDPFAPPTDAVANVDVRRPPGERATGRGVVVGFVDTGCDFTHPDFRLSNGGTRILALWDQRSTFRGGSNNQYGYGAIHSASDIDRALATPDPFSALGYQLPASTSEDGALHGTHVASIAAGNGHAQGPLGVAPNADLVFVEMVARRLPEVYGLADSATLLEAVDFIARVAGSRPWVVNLSLGEQGGPHDGLTLIEQGLDEIVRAGPGRAICQSTGNYFGRRSHAAGNLRPGDSRVLRWEIDAADVTPNEMEIWYSGRDSFAVEVRSPDGQRVGPVKLGEQRILGASGQELCKVYHRAKDPNNHDNQVVIFVYPGAAGGSWEVELFATDVVDGRFNAWVERDAACPGCASRLAPEDAVQLSTTGTICNGFRTIVVGAYNPHSPHRELASFSSAGPTRDGRVKPDLIAPGVSILAARSASPDLRPTGTRLTRMSGTSMAAPHVTGTVALMFEAAGRPLRIEETRALLLANAEPARVSGIDLHRVGSGYLNIERAVEATRTMTLPQLVELPTRQAQPSQLTQIPGEEQGAPDSEASPEPELARNFVIISGGPGKYVREDPRHDQGWQNFVEPVLKKSLEPGTRRIVRFWEVDENVHWLIYKPAYVARWQDDLRHDVLARRDATQAVKRSGFRSYVDLLEHRAKDRGWTLHWLDNADDVWDVLETLGQQSISRVWTYSHASDSLWFSVNHRGSVASPPEPEAILRYQDIKNHRALRNRFVPGGARPDPNRTHRFFGCSNSEFAQAWAETFSVWAEGFSGTITFENIGTNPGYDPTPIVGCRLIRYTPGGAEARLAEVAEADLDAIEPSYAADVLPDEPEDATLARSGDDVDVVELVAEALANGMIQSPTAFLDQLLEASGRDGRGGLEGSAAGSFVPNVIVEAFSSGRPTSSRAYFEQYFEVIAAPGGVLSTPIQPGDVLLRSVPGTLGHAAIVAAPGIYPAERLPAWMTAESAQPGWFAKVIEGGVFPHGPEDEFCRRVLDASGRMPTGQLLMRPTNFRPTTEASPPAKEVIYVVGVDYDDAPRALYSGSAWRFAHPRGARSDTNLTLFDYVALRRRKWVNWNGDQPPRVAAASENAIVSVLDLYEYIKKLPAGSVAELHFFTHGVAGGPVLRNTYDTSLDPNLRDARDFDPRIKDFRVPTVLSGSEGQKFKNAFAYDAIIKLWGCTHEQELRDWIRFEYNRAPNAAKKQQAKEKIQNYIRDYTYQFALHRLTGIPVYAAPIGYGTDPSLPVGISGRDALETSRYRYRGQWPPRRGDVWWKVSAWFRPDGGYDFYTGVLGARLDVLDYVAYTEAMVL